MEDMKQYILTIVSVAVLSSVLLKLLNDKSSAYKLIKLMCGIIMVLTIVSPWTKVTIDDYLEGFEWVKRDAAAVQEEGEILVQQKLKESITERTEAYILDKAALLGADISVSITCTTSDVPIPISVELSGNASPYAKSRLRQILSSDVGIPEDKQIWT